MSYVNKTYVCFDADTDILYYRLMTAWKENDKIQFNFHNAHELNKIHKENEETEIKSKLRERLKNTKVLVVLIGKKTKNLYKYVRWEIEYAVEKDIPIIAVNLNGKKKIDAKLCPPILKQTLAMHIPFGQKIIDYALNKWPTKHESYKKHNKPCNYTDTIYKALDKK
jgi:hypothetical protein